MSLATILTNQVIDHIYKNGGWGFRASSTGIYDEKARTFRTAPKKGVADILACYRGRFIAIEIKIGKDHLSPEQQGFLANVTHYGGLSVVVKDFDQFVSWWQNNCPQVTP